MNYKKETQFKDTEKKFLRLGRLVRMELKPNKALMRQALEQSNITAPVDIRQKEVERNVFGSEKGFRRSVVWRAFFGSSISLAVLAAFLLASLNINFAITDADLFALEAEAYELDSGLDEEIDLSILETELEVEIGLLESELN